VIDVVEILDSDEDVEPNVSRQRNTTPATSSKRKVKAKRKGQKAGRKKTAQKGSTAPKVKSQARVRLPGVSSMRDDHDDDTM
jgi:hypothetical protein